MDYYSIIISIIIATMMVLCILVKENGRLTKADRISFYMTYATIAAAAISEWLGVLLNGNGDIPTIVIKLIKCADYMLTPTSVVLFIEQMKLRNIWRRIAFGILTLNAVLQVASIFTGCVATIDSSNHYTHGKLYELYLIFAFSIMIILIIEFAIYGTTFSKQNRVSLYAIMFLVCLGVTAQETIGGEIRTTYLGITIASVLMFIHIAEFTQLEADERLFEQEVKLRETAALKKAKKAAEEASKAKSDFLANMSHEIRTPINAILGMNEIIIRECEDENVLSYSENIKTAGNTLLGLINDVLDFSKIEAGKIEIIPNDYNLSAILNDLVNMVQTRADNKDLTLTCKFNPDIPVALHGDDIRIKQIITNILTNAVKYTKKGGITFTMDYENIENDPDNIILNVSVKDTGIGIKEEDMSKLFSEFERIEEQRNKNVEGTGLGMSITTRLLKMMDSELTVNSEYGKGSEFSFAIKQKVVDRKPLGDYSTSYKEHTRNRRNNKSPFTAPNARVLMIDDNSMNLQVFAGLLKRSKIKIDSALTGDEGIEFVKNNSYDILFIDHMMPKKDGIETLHEIRALEGNPNQNAPSICLTANAISGAKELYLAEGFEGYLAKPINITALENMLMEYLPKDKLIMEES